MQTSQVGLNLIESEEGLELHTYNDIVGVATIGYGHKLLQGEAYPNGITQEEAQGLLQNDARNVETVLNELNLGLNQNQFDALVDFGFNLGTGALKQLLSHGLTALPTQILLWDHAGGRVITGLLLRRQKELALFQTPISD